MAHIIKVCMGSSCFARGNAKNLQIIQNFLEQHDIDAEVELSGLRCCNQCAAGPNITIDNVTYHGVDSGTLLDILEKVFQKEE